ncbi:helix-turn-helix domain-containing protein [Pseudomonas sp. MPFS]|nr:helix-turn-helix domain-containing protein [Pseudomonas sp. MPFS]
MNGAKRSVHAEVNALIPVPAISLRLREITLEFASTPSIITGKVNKALTRMEGYKSLEPGARKDLEDSLIYTARLWCETLLSGECLSEEARSTLKEIGRRRVHQGVPLQSLMRGFSLGGREIWKGYLELSKGNDELSRELLSSIFGFMLDYFDDIAEEVVQSYLDEQIQKTHWREYLHQRLNHILFHAPQDAEGFQSTLLALGLDPQAPRVALALDIPLQTTHPLLYEDELDRLTLVVSRNFKVPAKELIRVWYQDKLVIWLPGIQGETMSQCDQRIAKSASSLLTLMPQLQSVGIGMVNHGVAGWVSSAEEAIKAIDLFPFDKQEPHARHYSSILIEDSVRGNENTLRYLVSLIEQLANEPELLLTLEEYFLQGRRRAHTAKTLGIHPNTLNYRLGRIEILLHANLNDINWVSRLDTALKLRRHSINKARQN